MTLLAGLGFGLGLIVAIGAQNAFILRQGLRREHVGVVVAICAGSDLVLITIGTAGVGGVVAANPTVLRVVTVLGAGVLVWYAVLAARRAVRSDVLDPQVAAGPAPAALRSAVLSAVALTWLNPHVYLDTVVLLGTVSTTYARPWLFALGAGMASIGWFTALGYGARVLAPVMRSPSAWRVLDAGIAVVMVVIAGGLVLGLAAPG